MTIQGLRTTENFATNERPESWRKGLLMLDPNGMAPLTALTSQMKEESVDDPNFHWWEKRLQSRRISVNASLTAVAAGTTETISVASGAFGFKAGDVFWAEKGSERMQVLQDPIVDTSINVLRGAAGTTPEVITYATHNPYLVCIGSAYEEGSAAPTGVNFDPTEEYNYCEIFRNTYESTNTAIQTNLRSTDQQKEARREVLQYHGIDMERAFWWGKRYKTMKNGKPLRFTGGIDSFIAAENIIDKAGAATTMLVLEGWMEQAFRYGSNEKMVFCGNRALLTINQIVRKNTSFQITSGIKEYGMEITRLVCPFGSLVIKTHPLFNQMGSSTSPAYYGADSWFYILDMSKFKYKYLRNRDTKFEAKLEENGLDGSKSGWITECGLEVAHPETHMLIKGLALAGVDAA
jgi:hypothetical protein